MKQLLIISTTSIILSIGIVFVLEIFMGAIMGGVRTYIGFPIPYYINDWFTPIVELDQPILKYVNILLYSITLTAFYWFIIKPSKN